MSTTESDETAAPRLAQTYAEAEDALLSRWPEQRIDPSLDRIRDLVDLLADPQAAYPVVHLTGTNGKTSTARMVETLLLGLGLRTGRYTSPHLESMTQRISLDGEPIAEEDFVAAFNDVAPYLTMVDADHDAPLSFFETITAMAYAAFADSPVDAAVVEVGMGGTWDATNVVDAKVAVITPIAVDHEQYLGSTTVEIAREKSGIIKEGTVVVTAVQDDDVMAVLEQRCLEVGATMLREGVDFAVTSRNPAVGGQMLGLEGVRASYAEVFLPVYGAHQAHNAVLALAAVESLLGGSDPLDAEVVGESFAQVTTPGRLEIVRRSPTIVLDAAHNPHGAEAVVDAVGDSFSFDPLIGVVAVMADKDHEQLLSVLEPVLGHVVCTQNSLPRSLPAEELAEEARGIFGHDRVSVAADLGEAISQAATLAEDRGEAIGSGAVLVTGSVVTVGEARALLVHERSARPTVPTVADPEAVAEGDPLSDLEDRLRDGEQG